MKERGFTIIEVAMFLAISGSLVLLTLGLWNMVARQRFQDTMTTLRGTIQSEYEEVRTSINERLGDDNITNCENDGSASVMVGRSTTGNTKCLVIGKLIQFAPGGVDVNISYVVAKDGASSTYSDMGDEEALRAISGAGNLLVIGNSSSSYNAKTGNSVVAPKSVRMEWGGEFATNWTIPASGNPRQSNSLAILHSPVSSAVLVFSFATNSNVPTASGVLNLNNASVNQPLAIMVRNSQVGFRGAAICIDGGSSSVAVRTVVPADPHYDFNAARDNSAYSPGINNLRNLCNI